MKPAKILFIITIGLMTSCYKVYDPHIDTAGKVLVVNGLMTNQADVYHVILTYAKPFNSSEKGTPLSAANVYVTDDLGNSYIFNEMGKGDYISDSLQLTGIIGHTYRLHIITPDGEEYISDPQRLFPEVYPDSVYTEFDYKEILERSTGLKIKTHGANILTDIKNQADTLPNFRFTSNLVRQYFYTICPIMEPCIFFYCWQTVNANSNINLINWDYSVDFASVRKHTVCFLDDNLYCFALFYSRSWPYRPATYYQFFEIHHRILYLNLYTLNNETYLYYKSLDEQIQSEGKLFDPIAAQLNGNIECISNPEKRAIGFFEASSVSNSAYIVDFRNLKNSQPALIKIPYILPPEYNGCRINNTPLFWVFI